MSNGVRLKLSNRIRQYEEVIVWKIRQIYFLRILAGASGVLAVNSVEWEKGTGIVMEQYKLGEMEQRLAQMIWENAPIASGQLAKLCESAFGWKRTTSYTMLKRLCDRGIFCNENGVVRVIMSGEEFRSAQGELFINENFGGSLPQFLLAFSRRKRLSEKEVEQLKKLIEEYET